MKWEKLAFIAAWIMAILGGGYALLFTFACYMTSTGYIPTDEMLRVLPWPSSAIVLALVGRQLLKRSGRPAGWGTILPVCLIAGLPALYMLLCWIDHH